MREADDTYDALSDARCDEPDPREDELAARWALCGEEA